MDPLGPPRNNPIWTTLDCLCGTLVGKTELKCTKNFKALYLNFTKFNGTGFWRFGTDMYSSVVWYENTVLPVYKWAILWLNPLKIVSNISSFLLSSHKSTPSDESSDWRKVENRWCGWSTAGGGVLGSKTQLWSFGNKGFALVGKQVLRIWYFPRLVAARELLITAWFFCMIGFIFRSKSNISTT